MSAAKSSPFSDPPLSPSPNDSSAEAMRAELMNIYKQIREKDDFIQSASSLLRLYIFFRF